MGSIKLNGSKMFTPYIHAACADLAGQITRKIFRNTVDDAVVSRFKIDGTGESHCVTISMTISIRTMDGSHYRLEVHTATTKDCNVDINILRFAPGSGTWCEAIPLASDCFQMS